MYTYKTTLHINSADDRIVHGKIQNMYSSYITNTHTHTYTYRMASLHSSPWTQHNIHVGHSPRNGSVPSVYILRSTRELILATFSKGSATEPASVIERRALFWKKCLFLLLLVYYVYHAFAPRQRIPLAHTRHALLFVPLSFSTVTLWYVRAHIYTQWAHTVVFIGVAPPALL